MEWYSLLLLIPISLEIGRIFLSNPEDMDHRFDLLQGWEVVLESRRFPLNNRIFHSCPTVLKPTPVVYDSKADTVRPLWMKNREIGV